MNENKEIVNVEQQNQQAWEESFENSPWILPVVDVVETNDSYELTANFPGVSRENIKISIEEGQLIIMGRNQRKSDGKYLLKESRTGNYYRKFNLSDGIDTDKISAKFESGQILVSLPKHERIKPKEITIL